MSTTARMPKPITYFSHSFMLLVIIISTLLLITFTCSANDTNNNENTTSQDQYGRPLTVPIGVVLDLNSPLGAMAELCITMAVSDFYDAHPNYTTRLQMHAANADGVLDANFAASEFLRREEVRGIIGPQKSAETTVLSELGQKHQIPIISFVSQSSRIPYSENRYFVRTALDNAIQAQALAEFFQKFEWSEIALLYEDSYYGYQFLSDINNALQKVEKRVAYTIVIPSLASDSYITNEMRKVRTRQTKVFLVHMCPSLGFRLFNLAKSSELMTEGYAWIMSDSLSIFMNSISSATRGAMEGVIGIRPYVSNSKELESFQKRFRSSALMSNKSEVLELNVYGLWAYDSVTALAYAVERLVSKNGLNRTNLKHSVNGTELLKELTRTRFTGLSGEFELAEGKRKVSGFEIFNVFGTGEKTIGFWTPDRGIDGEWNSNGRIKPLKSIIWPGDSTQTPKGWNIPEILKVGVTPKGGFHEFVDAIKDPKTNVVNATGFAIDIFCAALQALPFSIKTEFLPIEADITVTYDEILASTIPKKEYDVIVGDLTIYAPRAEYVDFTLPYSESGVILVVRNERPFDMWIFIWPLRWDLWLAIFITCILMGIVIRVLERNTPNKEANSTVTHKKRSGSVYWSPITVLAFPERNMISNNWSFFVLVLWLFMAFILMQSYTANLSAILTVDQLNFAFSDNHNIGWQEGSFMKDFLTKRLDISESRLKSYSTPEDYHKAMSLGSKNGGIDAIFDEVPYMKIFIKKYGSLYKMVGPTYRTGGFGFAFPHDSPLVAKFSKAILDVTQGPTMVEIERRNFGIGYSSQDQLYSTITQKTASLTLFDFAGLFLIMGVLTFIALFCSETTIGRKMSKWIMHFIHRIMDIFRRSTGNQVMDHNGDSAEESSSSSSSEADHAPPHVANNDTIASSTVEDINASCNGHGIRRGRSL